MVTAWSNEVEDEHRLLTGAARVLFRNPVLPADVLQGVLRDGIEITTEVAQPESFKDVVDIWSVLDNDLHPSVRVTVTVPLELDVEYESPAVRGHDVGVDSPTWTPGPTKPMRMTGRVEQNGQPVVGALVRADYASATTDERGEYALNNVTPGRQLFWVRVDGTFYQMEVDLPKDNVITLPAAETPPESSGGDAPAPAPDQPPRTPRRTRNRE
jgi:hypothetical protein